MHPHLQFRASARPYTRVPHGTGGSLAFLILLFSSAVSVQAQTSTKPNKMVVTITDTPDPAPSASQVTYQVMAKNDGRVKSTDVTVTVDVPPDMQVVSCKTSLDKSAAPRCQGLVQNQVLATFPVLRAHQTVKVTLVVMVPAVGVQTEMVLAAKAEGEMAYKGDATERTTVLTVGAPATLLPSGRMVTLRCGDVLDPTFFGTDTIVQLNGTLGCQANEPIGLHLAQAGVVLQLQGYKLIAGATVAGNVGIVLGANVRNVTIDGGNTNGGIEFFDWCVKDAGGNDGFVIRNLRCYRARSAAIQVVSNNVVIEKAKIDNTAPSVTTTAELPGGIGIAAHGDNIRVKDTIVRRSALIGILADGSDVDGSGQSVTIEGNTSTSRIESNFGIGVVLRNGPHLLKRTAVYGDGPQGGTATSGVLIETGIGHAIDGVVVKKFQTAGIVVSTSGARVERAGAEEIGQAGVVLTAAATTVLLNNCSVKRSGQGFEIGGENNSISTNAAEQNTGDGFQIRGYGNHVENNSAEANGGMGYLITGQANVFNTNAAQANAGVEWQIGAQNIDDSDNDANGHRFSFGLTGGTFE